VRTAAAAAATTRSYRLQKIPWHHRLHTEDAASSIGKAENQKIQTSHVSQMQEEIPTCSQ
jgi:hypothetical protein